MFTNSQELALASDIDDTPADETTTFLNSTRQPASNTPSTDSGVQDSVEEKQDRSHTGGSSASFSGDSSNADGQHGIVTEKPAEAAMDEQEPPPRPRSPAEYDKSSHDVAVITGTFKGTGDQTPTPTKRKADSG